MAAQMQIELGDLTVDVVHKDIQNVHLSVYPPSGHVRISAPERMSVESLRLFAVSKLGWIRRQQRQLQKQERETPRDYVSRESHYVWGERYLMELIERDAPPTIDQRHTRLLLQVRPHTDRDKRHALVESWYRDQLKAAVAPLLDLWLPKLGVDLERFYVQRMKTKWGSCNHRVRTIRLNTELAKKPPECLEYIVVHELIHLLEPSHNERFTSLMDHFMPRWHLRRDLLNRLPVARADWSY